MNTFSMSTNEEYTESVLKNIWPEDRKVPLDKPFGNSSGLIQNLCLKPNSCVSLIYSIPNSMRSNHYHKTDYHYLYILSGEVLYLEREVGDRNIYKPVYYAIGDMIFTPPMVEHVTIFPIETTLISISKNPRSHENHEQDLVRVNFISEEKKKEILDEFSH